MEAKFTDADGIEYVRDGDHYNVKLPPPGPGTLARAYPAADALVVSRSGRRYAVTRTSFGNYPVPKRGWVELRAL
jgi:hypothetical protein